MVIRPYRTVSIRCKPSDLTQAFAAMELAAKNLKNVGLFIVKNVLSSFDENNRIKPVAGLHKNQIEVLQAANAAAAACNKTRQAKNDEKTEKRKSLEAELVAKKITEDEFEEIKKTLKPAKLFPDFMGEDANPWNILDDSLLDKMMRTREDQNGLIPFEALPAKAAEQVRMQIIAEFKSWREGLKAYSRNPEKFTGRPKMPGYLQKNDRMPVKFFAGALGKERLPTIAGRPLATAFNGPVLPPEAFKAYSDFDLERCLVALGKQVDRAGATLMELRLVPGRCGLQKIEGVFDCPVDIPEHSFLAKMNAAAGAAKIAAERRPAFFAAEIGKLSAAAMPRSAALDVGLNNLATVIFSTGREAIVVSNTRIEAKLGVFDAKIDARTSALILAAPAVIAALALRRAQGERLDDSSFALLRQFDRGVQGDFCLQKMREDRAQWLHDALHKLSTNIVQVLIKEEVELLVAGHNVGWKNGADMGSDGNRRLHATPHSILLEMLCYKCQDAAVLMIEQEESYTSKASFALSQEIAIHSKEAKAVAVVAATSQSIQPQTKEGCTLPKTTPSLQPKTGDARRAMGTRAAPIGAKVSSKHQFRIPREKMRLLSGLGLGPAWGSLHADANGAYNILRKAIPAFRATPGLSPRFGLWWLSAQGLRAFKTASANC